MQPLALFLVAAAVVAIGFSAPAANKEDVRVKKAVFEPEGGRMMSWGDRLRQGLQRINNYIQRLPTEEREALMQQISYGDLIRRYFPTGSRKQVDAKTAEEMSGPLIEDAGRQFMLDWMRSLNQG